MACLTCIDALRRLRRRPRLECSEQPVDVASGDPSPLEVALRRDTQRSVEALLATTSQECRNLWSMIQMGLTYKEMATRVGVAETTLRVRVYRCRRRALELLESNVLPARDDERKVESDGLP
jgi:DNA-directed RNA polymerase specialized sigma24 family protein